MISSGFDVSESDTIGRTGKTASKSQKFGVSEKRGWPLVLQENSFSSLWGEWIPAGGAFFRLFPPLVFSDMVRRKGTFSISEWTKSMINTRVSGNCFGAFFRCLVLPFGLERGM